MARTARSQPPQAEETITVDLEVADRDLLMRLTGPGGDLLRSLEEEWGVSVGVRGNQLTLRGAPDAVERAQWAASEVLGQLEKNPRLARRDVLRAVRTLNSHPEVRLADFMDEPVLVAPRKTIVPKGVAQAKYVQAIREHDVVFGIGPAGTGKTYLAMAMAVSARRKTFTLNEPQSPLSPETTTSSTFFGSRWARSGCDSLLALDATSARTSRRPSE